MASADFDGDGKLDLAVVYAGCCLRIFLGNGDGTFKDVSSYGGIPSPDSLVTGDFNGDGKIDFVITGLFNTSADNTGTGYVQSFLGKGDGNFDSSWSFSYPGTWSGSGGCTAGDFNGDGKLDLAATGTQVYVFLGKGDGSFNAPVGYDAGNVPSAVATGDLNRDGRLDLAIADQDGTEARLLLGNGDGTFATSTSTKVSAGSARPQSITLEDFNGDCILDLVVTGDVLSVVLGRGDGTFGSPANYPILGLPPSGRVPVATGDFNGDGRLDLAYGGDSATLLVGRGDGTFKTAVSYGAGSSPSSLTAGDFNGDGKLDLATDTVSLLLNGGCLP